MPPGGKEAIACGLPEHKFFRVYSWDVLILQESDIKLNYGSICLILGIIIYKEKKNKSFSLSSVCFWGITDFCSICFCCHSYLFLLAFCVWFAIHVHCYKPNFLSIREAILLYYLWIMVEYRMVALFACMGTELLLFHSACWKEMHHPEDKKTLDKTKIYSIVEELEQQKHFSSELHFLSTDAQ